jgi:hypothetical protein
LGNLNHGLKIDVRRDFERNISSFRIEIDGKFFPKPYVSGADKGFVFDMFWHGDRRPFWYAKVDPYNFGKHVVSYSGDSFGNQIFLTQAGALFSDMWDDLNDNWKDRLFAVIVKYYATSIHGR